MNFITDHFQLIRRQNDFLSKIKLPVKPTVLGIVESVVLVEILRTESALGSHRLRGLNHLGTLIDHDGIRTV